MVSYNFYLHELSFIILFSQSEFWSGNSSEVTHPKNISPRSIGPTSVFLLKVNGIESLSLVLCLSPFSISSLVLCLSPFSISFCASIFFIWYSLFIIATTYILFIFLLSCIGTFILSFTSLGVSIVLDDDDDDGLLVL